MKIMVIGTDKMACGIAQILISNGNEVIIRDKSNESIEKGVMSIVTSLEKDVSKGKIKEDDKDQVLKRISATTDIKRAADCDLIIETIDDNMKVKKDLFRQLDHICKRDTVFATNTSNLSITEIASSITRPEKLVGMRFFNPVLDIDFVEITHTNFTSKETYNIIKNFSDQIKKKAMCIKEVIMK
ncbi:3-hydroxyacyl-CoA dehydrogenase family protein [Romboutsia sp.]|uniref:3-hydroxyacyl-CoA dehydrogenase family protein n=1 Tax=Romboutsia sp. TaxID=1965302 RepID=UPI003F2D59ED